MNREQVIALAREAGLDAHDSEWLSIRFERFAALVAAHEREACAKVCDKRADEDGWEGSYAHQCAAAIRSRT